MAETPWTEHNVAANEITIVDHYPLSECKGDQWDFISYAAGLSKEQAADMIKPIKMRIDKTVAFIRYYIKGSTGTFIFRLFMSGRLIGEDTKTVTTEEETYMQINMPKLQSSGEGDIHLLAKGPYQAKADTMKVVAFYEAGWDEHSAPDTEWTEHVVGE